MRVFKRQYIGTATACCRSTDILSFEHAHCVKEHLSQLILAACLFSEVVFFF
jgi:hypothetical protein